MESAVVWYYCRAALYGQMCAVAQSSAARGEESRLLYGIALALAGRVADSLAELEPLTRSDLACPALHAMIHAHRMCEAVDREAVSQLESRLQPASREAGERGMAMAARFLVHGTIGGHDVACGYKDRLLRQDSTSGEGLALKGWLQLSEGHVKPAAQSFRAAAQDKNNVDAIFGLVATMPPQEGISQLNQLIVRFPNVTPPLMEKMRLQVALREWDLAMDTATRVLSQEQSNVVALQARLLEQIAVSGRYQDGVSGLRRLATELERQEPTSWMVCLNVAVLFSGICSRHPGLLVETHRLAERAVSLAPLELAPLLELGRQCCLAGRYAEADKAYRSAVNLDDSSVEALVGLTSVQFAQNGLTSQVRQQLDFLWEVGGESAGAELLLMRGQMADGDPTPLLDQAFKVQRAAADGLPYGDSYLRALRPDVLVDIATHYPDTTEGGKSRCSILELVVSMCPGHVEAVVGLAQCHIAGRQLDIALGLLKQLTERLDPTNTQAHLLIAHVLIEQEDYAKAGASLELCLSYNLDAQRQPLYHLLAGIVSRHCGDHTAAIRSFNAALSANLTSVAGAALRSDELCWLYVSLSESQLALGERGAAGAMLERAERELGGPEQRDRIAMASSELARRRGDTAHALALLEGLTRPPLYAQACLKRAAIHLEELKDGRAYAACYKQLADSDPSTENLILLGDAYLAIQEPDRAIEAYEQALQGASTNKKLACKLGHALVKTHQYGSAIKCFRNAGEDGSVELAQLLLRLGQLEIAESTLSHVPLTHKALILAKVREKSGDVPGALATLEEARRMLGRSDAALGYELSRRMAEYATMLHDHDTAIRHHKACLAHRPADSQAQIALAKLFMQVNDWASCQASCSSLLSAEPDNEPALLMLADLAFRRVDFAGAAVHFARLLSRRPTYWIALARLIEVKRRMAQLGDVNAYLDAAGGTKVPGLSYCTGLHLWYSGAERSLPLQQFNQCRGDAEWGQQALHNMVELCMGEPTAARLLQEMRPHTPDEQMSVRLLAAFVRLAAPHEKGDMEAAIAEFSAIAQHDAFRIGSTLGLASAYMAQKQTTRARNVLKRVAQTAWQFEAAEHLERCWLLLAELNVQAGKHDVATELLRRVLQHNQSCHRAYSLLGLVAEKEQKYVEASVHYQLAWKMSGSTDPSLGYKLALNLLKGKRYADAISLCHAVLRLSPKYPRIRKDILDKAIAQLRT